MSINWNKIKTEYITTDISYRDIAEKYEISKTAIEKQSEKENWINERRQYKDELKTKVIEAAGYNEAEAIRKMKEKERKQFDLLQKLLNKTILTYKDVPTPLDVDRLISAQHKLQTMIYKNYGIANKHEVGGFGNKPISIDLSGMTKEELEKVKECQRLLKSQ
jgi:predicted DNA-binding protein YlxM (UPF0122 family)